MSDKDTDLQGTAGGPGGTAPGGTSPEGATGTFGTDGPIPGTSTPANAHATGEDDGSGQVDMEAARRKLRDSIHNVEPKPST